MEGGSDSHSDRLRRRDVEEFPLKGPVGYGISFAWLVSRVSRHNGRIFMGAARAGQAPRTFFSSVVSPLTGHSEAKEGVYLVREDGRACRWA